MKIPYATLAGAGGSGGDPARGGESAVTLSLAEALADLPLTLGGDVARARDVRLGPPAAAALVAALDWLSGALPTDGALDVRVDHSALEIGCLVRDARGLAAAGEVLAAAGGNLRPAATEDGRRGEWRLRVPLAAERESWLLLWQGELELALPWTAVQRIFMATRAALEAAGGGVPTLEPLATTEESDREIPVALIGHGLKRAYFAADRLVWRLPAAPASATGAAPAPGLTHPLRADDGATYWAVDPSIVLAGVAPPPVPEGAIEPVRAPEPAPASADATPHELTAADVIPHELTAADVIPLAPPAAAPAPTEPTSAPVATPLAPAAPARVEVPAPVVAPARAPAATPAPTPLPPAITGARRALLAEDSLIARLFLTRMLERRGFEVTPVGTAAELGVQLGFGAWSLVLVDVELPDAFGVDLLSGVVARAARLAARPSALVALVRDADDSSDANKAGVAHVLGKPFDNEALDAMLAAVGLAGSR